MREEWEKMAGYDSDIKLIRTVGHVIVGIGIALMLFTIIIGAVGVLSAQTIKTSSYTLTSLAQLVLGFGMGISMIGCGTQMAQPGPLVGSAVESMRLSWAALFGAMFITWLLGFWLQPVLGALSLLVLLLLILIRAAVVRISA